MATQAPAPAPGATTEQKDYHTTGTASRALSVLLRLGELASGAIVLGLLGRLFYLLDNAGVSDPSARLVYAVVIASLTILASLVLLPPLAYSFWLFPVDWFFFAAWLAAFIALETLTGTDTCSSDWYNTYWGYYWGRWYLVGPVGIDVNWAGCSAWKTVLAFSFIASITFLLSGILGLYWVIVHGRIHEHRRRYMGCVYIWSQGKKHPLTFCRRFRRRRGVAAESGVASGGVGPRTTTGGPMATGATDATGPGTTAGPGVGTAV
ncbi:hypothetical protein QBC47DRAFT_354510 [Echria macrotheca]|uniref:MARVEL domain-containing protein n=1 Tax=Echria macrotheca TaxID=438768 RepID=A0AAJ0B232_9PEZI|nr:hypothetical protein QBC47DRAFT_354510 [Echria macrotheca]